MSQRASTHSRHRVPTWVALQMFTGAAWVVAGLVLLLIYQAEQLQYLPCDCKPAGPRRITFRSVDPRPVPASPTPTSAVSRPGRGFLPAEPGPAVAVPGPDKRNPGRSSRPGPHRSDQEDL